MSDKLKISNFAIICGVPNNLILSTYKKYVGYVLVSPNAFAGRHFRLCIEDNEIKIIPVGLYSNSHEEEMQHLLGADTTIKVAVLPKCFKTNKKISDFEVGQQVAMVTGFNYPHEYDTIKNATAYVEYGFVKKLEDNSMGVELNAIPGQIETIHNAAAVVPKLDIIPFLNF